MTFEHFTSAFVSVMMIVIGYLVKRLINTIEQRLNQTEETMSTLNEKLVDILQRLVRLEERNHIPQVARKRVQR